MKWVKDFENFKKNDKQSNKNINESFLGALFKGLKNLSKSLAGKFDNSGKIDKIIDEYKSEILSKMEEKLKAIKEYGEYIKSTKTDNKEIDNKEIKRLEKNKQDTEKSFDQQLNVIKQKYNKKLREELKNSDDKKLRNYVNLKKLELQQEILQKETEALLPTGLKEEDLKGTELENKLKQTKEDLEKAKKGAEKEEEIIKEDDLDSEEGGFDVEAALSDENYNWENSPYLDYEFEEDDKIKYFSKSNEGETNAIVISDLGDKLKVKTIDGDNEIEINKKAIIASENYKNQQEEEKQEQEDESE